MILIITHKLDFTADFLINKLNDKSIDYFRLNCEDIPKTKHCITDNNHFNLQISGNVAFHSVWFRRTKLPEINLESLNERLYLANEYDALFSNFYNTIKTERWLSNPDSVYKAENKMLQLKVAQQIGFSVPNTIITNDIDELKSFANSCQADIIIKPLAMGRIETAENVKIIFTNKVKKEHLDDIQSFTLTPTIFQKYIEKEFEVRVTVVANKVFAARIDSQNDEETKIDWRRKKLVVKPFQLPIDIESLCVALVHKLGLSFGAIDLIRTKTGEFFFLEVNPNGQWAWLEIEGGLKISDAIIEFLTE